MFRCRRTSTATAEPTSESSVPQTKFGTTSAAPTAHSFHGSSVQEMKNQCRGSLSIDSRLDLGFGIWDLGFGIRLTFQISDFRFQISDFRFQISDLKSQIRDPKSEIPNPKS